jgi:uncharacterized protein YecE (DUF72 family)
VGEVRIGISGWRYRAWRGDFYPQGLRQRDELAYAAARFDTVEVNGSFYSLQRPSSYLSWREQTPEGFLFAVKGGRFITHLKRLRDVEAPLANFFASGVLGLGDRLGPVLWQLPERVHFDAEVLDAFLAQLPRTVAEAAELGRRHDAKLAPERVLTDVEPGQEGRRLRHTLEPRHESFGSEEALALLRAHDVALVVAESAGRWPCFEAVTSDLVHVRLHGDEELYSNRYSDAALDRWAERVRAWSERADVFVHFDNDAHGHAPHDALRLAARLPGAGPARAR